jgi:hypothetical protein
MASELNLNSVTHDYLYASLKWPKPASLLDVKDMILIFLTTIF